jgi:hypothetical protein
MRRGANVNGDSALESFAREPPHPKGCDFTRLRDRRGDLRTGMGHTLQRIRETAERDTPNRSRVV